MLMVDHYVSSSKIHGLGVFTSIYIPRGALVWQYNPIVDQIIPEATLAELPRHAAQLIQTHAEYHREDSCYILGADGDYYMNHSDDPTLVDHKSTMFAARDLQPGDELTCDYRLVVVSSFDPETANLDANILKYGRKEPNTTWKKLRRRTA